MRDFPDNWFTRRCTGWNCPDDWFWRLFNDWNCRGKWFERLSLSLGIVGVDLGGSLYLALSGQWIWEVIYSSELSGHMSGNWLMRRSVNQNWPDNKIRRRSISWNCPDHDYRYCLYKYKYKLVFCGRSLWGRFGSLSQDCQPWFARALNYSRVDGFFIFLGIVSTGLSVCWPIVDFGVKRPAVRRHTTRVIGLSACVDTCRRGQHTPRVTLVLPLRIIPLASYWRCSYSCRSFWCRSCWCCVCFRCFSWYRMFLSR